MVTAQVRPFWQAQLDKWSVVIFCLVVPLVSATAVLLLPTYVGPILVVFVPTLTAVILVALTAGWSQIRKRLFSRAVWHISVKWMFISLGIALGLRLGISLLGLVRGHPIQPGSFTLLLALTFFFAAGEEIGWRGFALTNLLARGWSPLTAALLLGVPWGLLHLPLTLPGKLSAGTPMLAQFLSIWALSVLITWVYLAAGRSLTAAVLLHCGQNAFVMLNNGLPPVLSGWAMAIIYSAAAVVVILITRSRLGWMSQAHSPDD